MKQVLCMTLFVSSLAFYHMSCSGGSQPANNANDKTTPSASIATPDTDELTTALATSFVPGCTLPFESIKGTSLAIDSQCGKDGTAKPNTSGALQNEVKNNFCAKGTPIELSFSTFDDLQRQAQDSSITFGGENQLPKDRSALSNLLTFNGQKIGEGTVVSLTATVFDSRHSNVKEFNENGESVNCKSDQTAMNDIHIELADPSAPTDECKTVTAEISPHFRPVSWDRFDVNPKTAPDVNGLTQLKGAKVKISGQLFFDASHSPCVNGQGRAPVRRSIWEIHPVYSIDVFDTTKNKFVPLDTWAKGK